jgi:hypothetical protein
VTPEAIRHSLADVPEDELRQILGANAARVYGFDRAALDARAQEVGPTLAQVTRPLAEPPAVHADKHVFGRGRF